YLGSSTNLTVSSIKNALHVADTNGVVSGTSTLAVNFGGTGSTTLGGLLAGAGGSLTSATISTGLSFTNNTLACNSGGPGNGVVGCLVAADWTNFSNKVGSSTINSLTTNYLPRWNVTTFSFNNSSVYDTGTSVGIGTTTPYFGLTVASSTGPQFALSDS